MTKGNPETGDKRKRATGEGEGKAGSAGKSPARVSGMKSKSESLREDEMADKKAWYTVLEFDNGHQLQVRKDDKENAIDYAKFEIEEDNEVEIAYVYEGDEDGPFQQFDCYERFAKSEG